MTNLLHETREAIGRSGYAEKDIIFIGSEYTGHSCTWEEFTELANIEYDSGFGAAEVAQDLIIVFSDGAKMRRGECNGSEWWEFATPFIKPEETKPIKRLTVRGVDKIGWESLESLNK